MTTNKELTINEEPAWLAEVEGTPLATAGTENASADDLAMPMIHLLQKGSPICDKSAPEYVEGMEAGMLYNTVTQEAYPDGIVFCLCYFRTDYAVFASRDNGGGFFGAYSTDSDARQAIHAIAAEQKKVPEVFEVVRTGNHYGLLFSKGQAPQMAVIPMTSTKLAVSRQWLTMIRMSNKPAYAYKYRITSITRSNQKGSWYTYDVKKHMVNGQPDYLSDDYIQQARDVHELAKAMPINTAPASETVEF